jgi:hypothetical protein
MGADYSGLVLPVLSSVGAVVATVWTLRGQLERSLAAVNQSLALLTQKVDLINSANDDRMSRVEARLGQHDKDLGDLRDRMRDLEHKATQS